MISSQLEIIEQAKAYLKDLSVADYQQVIRPHFSSPAGAHMRHIIDHYVALRNGVADGAVDYNQRNRESGVEKDPQTALAVWNELEAWIKGIDESELNAPLQVRSEISVKTEQNETVVSSLGRELMFVASHAIHHYSLLAIIRSLQGGDNDATFGVAPATATYRRQTQAVAG